MKVERTVQGDIYIVGGGPSLKGFDWSRLRDKFTIVVNEALRAVPEPNIFLTADSWYCGQAAKNEFWKKNAYRIMVISPTHGHYRRAKPYLKYYNEVILPHSYNGNISLNMTKFATGRNSGFCAFQYAVLRHPEKIYLLGFDFHIKGGDHWHDEYKVGRSRLSSFASMFITAIEKLKEIAPNIEVISCSSQSPLNKYVVYESLELI